MSTTTNTFRSWRERQRARQGHSLVETEETNDDHPLQSEETVEFESETSQLSSNPTNSNTPVSENDDEATDIENQLEPLETSTSDPSSGVTVRTRSSRRTLTLADLEEERELARRRVSACVLVAAFILFRLWIQAVATGDLALLLMCLFFTSWTARFIRHNREREEELDRLIIEYNENGNEEISRNDVRMLSFQAQLALAIIESQREMMQGGFGNPDGPENMPGVSDEAMGYWDKFDYKDNLVLPGQSKQFEIASDEEEPHCSICLCEYEEGDKLVCLPCKHVYHADCVGSWCKNHTRCPLCNLDLESVADTADTSDSD